MFKYSVKVSNFLLRYYKQPKETDMSYFFKVMRSLLIINSLIVTTTINAVETTSSSVSSSNGVTTKTETYKFKAVDETDFLTSVSMISVGAVTSRLYKYKPTTDVMIGAAGGLMYVVGEVKSTMDFKQLTKDEEVTVTLDSSGIKNNEQADKLAKLKTSYDNAKKAAETKEKLQLAASAAFFTAAGASLLLKSSEMYSLLACESALTSAVSTCPEASPALGTAKASLSAYIAERETPKPSMAGHQASVAGKATLVANIEAASASASAIAAAECGTGIGCLKGSACAKSASEVQACNSVPLTLEQSESYGIMGSIAYDPVLQKIFNAKIGDSKKYLKKNHSFLYKVVSFIIDTADASYLNLLSGGGGLAAGYILTTFTAYGGYVDSQLLTPMKRAGVWATLGALSLYSANKSRGISEEMQQNSDKANSIVKEMNRLEKGIQTSNEVTETIDISKSIAAQNAIAISSDEKITTPCLNSESSGNCKSGSDQVQTLSGFANMPDPMKLATKNVMAVGDSLAGKSSISSASMSTISSLGSNAIASKKQFETIKKQLNDQAIKNGKDAIDFDKNEKVLLASLNSLGAKELAAKGVSAKDFMASINTSGLDPKKDTKEEAKKSQNAIGKNTAKVVGGNEKKEEKKPEEFKFNLGEVVGAEEANTAIAKNSKDEYELGAAQIHKDDGRPIWAIISNRYLRSAYPKLLEEIQPEK